MLLTPRFGTLPASPAKSPRAGLAPARWLALAAALVLPGVGCDVGDETLDDLRADPGALLGERRPDPGAAPARGERPRPDAGAPGRPTPPSCELGQVIPAPAGGYDPSCPALSSPCREAGATKTCLQVAQSGVRYAMEISCRPQRDSGRLAWLGDARGCLEGEKTSGGRVE